MEVKVNLTPEQINNQICEAIAKSAIGDELQKTINKQVEALSRSYNNPFDDIVKNHIRNQIEIIIRDEYADEIKEIVRKKVTEDFTNGMLEQLWNAWEATKDRQY